MNNKTFWIGFVVVYILWQVLGFVIFGMMLGEVHSQISNVFRPQDELNDMMWMLYVKQGSVPIYFCCSGPFRSRRPTFWRPKANQLGAWWWSLEDFGSIGPTVVVLLRGCRLPCQWKSSP